MKISVNWLKDYVTVVIPTEKLAHCLTMAGLEVERVERVGEDTVLEIEITPNRPDCLNYWGIAREAASILNKPLKLSRLKKIRFPSAKCDVTILDREGCGRYIGTVIENVNIGSSPELLSKRLQSMGLRTINNVVDVTIFCLLETGQPLHAFDYDKLIGGKIVVRRARAGETIVTIDGTERKLDPSILVIADAKRPVAIAGIMGGKETEVTSNTKNILLESAYFDPVLIRRAGRKLGLSSDSSYRFERGVDINTVETGANRAIGLIQQYAGGRIKNRTDLFSNKPTRRVEITARQISVTKNQIDSLLGTNLALSRCKMVFKQLGFQVQVNKQGLTVVPPSSRNDIKIVEDVVEEIARVMGYDNLPVSLPLIKMANIPTSLMYTFKKKLRGFLTALGLSETITSTMINQEILEKCGCGSLEKVRIKNPLTQDQQLLRPTLLPSLLSTVQLNFNHGQKNLKLFEIGKRYLSSGEKETLGMIMVGSRQNDWRVADKGFIEFYDIKGVVERLLENLPVDGAVSIVSQPSDFLVPRESSAIMLDGKNIVVVGKIKKEILKAWDIKQDKVYFAEINLELWAQQASSLRKYTPLTEYPAINRDISLAVKTEVPFADIRRLAFEEGGEHLTQVSFLEQYTGEKIPAGQRGIVFSLIYQSPRRTLVEEEVNKSHQKICQALMARFGAVIR